jgi:branched-chain amino acid aminotransferase
MKKIEIHADAVERVKKFTISDHQLGFGKYMSPIMIKCDYKEGEWKKVELLPYGPLSIDPCAKVLHYGQEIFEGLKAYKHADGNIFLFRPEQNAKRFNLSARRMAMPEIPEDIFLECCEVITAYSKNVIPRRSGEALYLRPFMIATEVGMGIKPANSFSFIVVASPSGSYFAGTSVRVYIEREDIRAAHGGTGNAKTGGNYGASLKSYTKTIGLHCDQTMWLDAIEHKYIEEMSGMNFFAVINGALHTPTLNDTILDGITRKSIIELAAHSKIPVMEKKMDINELLKEIQNGNCTEAFVCGTASVLAPISFLLDADGSIYHLKDAEGNLSLKLKEHLVNIQSGKVAPPTGWLRHVRNIEF